MTTERDILIEATKRGIRLEPLADNRLAYFYDDPPDPEFLELMRENKPALLRLLKSKLHSARQVLQGEFDGADAAGTRDGVIESLNENIFDPLCRQALDRLTADKLNDE